MAAPNESLSRNSAQASALLAYRHREDVRRVGRVEDGEGGLHEVEDPELRVALVPPALLALPRLADDVVRELAVALRARQTAQTICFGRESAVDVGLTAPLLK